MQNAPARQPRVSPAAPLTRRAWITPACLVGAAVVVGAVMLPPFAARSLVPNRSAVLSPAPSGAVEPAAAESSTPSAAVARTDDKADGKIGTKYSDLPVAAEPANEPPRNTAAE